MIGRKSLEKRIRGWFPKEPILISSHVKVKAGFETTQPPWVIPRGYDVGATKVAGAYAIFWTVITLLNMIISSLSFEEHGVMPVFGVLWIIVGLAIGVISSTIVTRSQLSRLSREYKFSANKKEAILLIVPVAVFFAFGFPYFVWLSSILWFWASLLAWGIPVGVIRYVLFYSYEKRENMRLVQSWWGTGIFVIPKPPNNSTRSLTG
jgi:hypothetical protein